MREPVDPEPEPETVPRAARLARDLLVEHWGADWPDIEARLLAKGFDFDQLVHPSFPSWEEVEEGLHDLLLAALSTNDPPGLRRSIRQRTDPEMNAAMASEERYATRRRKTLTDADREHILALAQPFEEPLEDLADEMFLAEYGYRQRIWDDGLYEAGPFLVPEPAYKPEVKDVVWISGSHNGWSIRAHFDLKLDPDCYRIQSEIQRVQAERRGVVRAYIDSL